MTWRLIVTIEDDQGNSITQATNFDPRMFSELSRLHDTAGRQRIFFLRINDMMLKLLYKLMPASDAIKNKNGVIGTKP